MNKFFIVAAVLGITMGWSMSAYAGKCPSLIKQIDEKAGMASLSEADSQKVQILKKDGGYHHRKGEHGVSVRLLNKALAILGG